MSDYLRDISLKNLLITEDRLTELHTLLCEIVDDTNHVLAPDDVNRLELNYILRFDNKGFVLRNITDVIRHFKHARKVQKLIIAISTKANAALPNIGPFRAPFDHHGKCIFIQLTRDNETFVQGQSFERQINNIPSYLLVTDDNSGWTEGTFSRIKERLDYCKSTSSMLIRAPWFPVTLRIILGVIAFTIALLGTLRLSDYFSSSAALAAIFILIFIVLNPVLTALYNPLMVLTDYFYPNVAFRELRAHWIIQGIIAIACAAGLVTVGGLLYKFLSSAIHPFLKP